MLEMNKKLLYLVDGNFKRQFTEMKTALEFVSIFLFPKTTKTFRALTVLCSSGYGEDAIILARCILENLICLTYIQKDESQHRVELFISYSEIDRKKKAEEIKDDPYIIEFIEKTNVNFDHGFSENDKKAIKMREDECEKIKGPKSIMYVRIVGHVYQSVIWPSKQDLKIFIMTRLIG
jgi:uncharacterized protein DUF5677